MTYNIDSKTYGEAFELTNGSESVKVRHSTDYDVVKTEDGERWFRNRGDGVWFELGDKTEATWEVVANA